MLKILLLGFAVTNNNKENLKPFESGEDAANKGKSGGTKSGIARRKKKQIKDIIRTLGELPLNEKAIKKINKEFPGLTDDMDLTEDVADVLQIKKILKGAQHSDEAKMRAFELLHPSDKMPFIPYLPKKRR